MLTLRPYQEAAKAAVYDHLRTRDDNPCAVLPTASGKTPLLASICKDAVGLWDGRVLILAHVKELLEQATDKLNAICPEVPFGVYSAGLRRRDTDHSVIVAGIQSVYKKACELGGFNLIIVDECFVAGTSVSTPAGEIPIEQVQPGMFVCHAMGIGQVLAVSARTVHELVTLEYSDGTSITCTPTHPIFTERGWKQAGSLELGSLAMGIKDMRMLRDSISALDEAACGRPPESPKGKTVAQTTILFDLLLENPQQLHAKRRSAQESECDPQGTWAQTKDTWWQRSVDQSAAGIVEPARRGVGCGACCSCTPLQEQEVAEESQDRRGQSTANDCSRAGWTQSSLATTQDAGLTQDVFPGSKRLVRITHHQPASQQVVFNLHVAGHPSYFANGILVHNCHLIPQEGEGMYRQFLSDAKVINPDVRVIGLTATPFRLKSGMICGPENILNHVCYEVGVKELIRDGYLCRLISKAGTQKADTSGLHVRAGEFVAGEVEDLMDQDGLVVAACAEIVGLTHDRHSCLIFASGVKHGQHIAKVLQEVSGRECGFVCGDTPTTQRDELLGRFKAGDLKYLANVNVLTTGFDAPNIDCVALLRPTMSPGLFYQMVGRSFRLGVVKQ